MRVAVIGCGRHGRECHLKSYAAMPDVEIVAVADADAARAEAAAAEFSVPRFYTDHQELLTEARPDVVSIVSPPAAHRQQTLDAFAAGAHVLCEKPLAMNVGEARQMVDAARSARRVLSMGLQSRFLASGRYLRQFLADGGLGDVYFTRVWSGHLMNIPGWGHFHRRALAGGGVLFATTVHILDFALWVLGNPQPVAVSGYQHQKLPRMKEPAITWEGPVGECDIEDFAYGMVRFADGTTMSLEGNWLMHPSTRPSGVEYLGNDGRATLHPLRIETDHGTEVRDVTPDVQEPEDGVYEFIRHMLACARGEEEPIIRFSQMLQVQHIMAALYKSASEGREVRIGPEHP